MDDFREKKIEADMRSGFYSEDKTNEEISEKIREFDKSIQCLAIQLPETIWNDINTQWQKIRPVMTELVEKREDDNISVLPLHLDNGESIYCDSISGGKDYAYQMPVSLRLVRRMPDGKEFRALYVQTFGG